MTLQQKEHIQTLGFTGLIRYQNSHLDLLLIHWMAKTIYPSDMTPTLRSNQILPVTPTMLQDTGHILAWHVGCASTQAKGNSTDHRTSIPGYVPCYWQWTCLWPNVYYGCLFNCSNPNSLQDDSCEFCGWLAQNTTKLHCFDWTGFVFEKLGEGISQWQTNDQSVNLNLNGSLLFLEVFYIMQTEVQGWIHPPIHFHLTDDMISERMDLEFE